ncbi:MAG: hypothetical protein JW891_01955 [Candidatus Lokiarchaeota archaeon]|nr:hypothetical protein [Candidatus Lokiarchaeota archaeon]
MSKKYIAFDSGHKCRGNIAENYSHLKELLESKDFECHSFNDAITQSSLKLYDILVFACPDFAKITSREINEIDTWVKKEGGGLLLLSHAGGDRGRSSNLNELAESFGIAFENDQVLDDKSNLGLENLPIIYSTSFNPPHIITNGLDTICYRAGCSSTIIGAGAIAIASSNETSDPFSTPLICISEAEKGRVCCMGSYEMFRNKVGGGMAYETHSALALNIFNWLFSEERAEIRKSKNIPAPINHDTAAYQYDYVGNNASSKKNVNIDNVNINYDIKISNKSELMSLLKLFSDQINTMKKTIDHLIEKVAFDENSIITGAQIAQNMNSHEQQQYNNWQHYEPQYETQGPEHQQEQYVEDTTDFIDYAFETQGKHVLSSLPEKPSSLKEKHDAPSGELDENLEPERESLGTKVKSVKELIEFIEKKHDAGELDDKSYKKQIKKLKSDLNKSQDRIKAIDKILKK